MTIRAELHMLLPTFLLCTPCACSSKVFMLVPKKTHASHKQECQQFEARWHAVERNNKANEHVG